MKKIIVILCVIGLMLVPSTMSLNISKNTKLSQKSDVVITTIISEFGFNGTVANITEIDSDGNIVWQLIELNVPQDAERLSNGNTLIVLHGDEKTVEVDQEGNIVWEHYTGKGSLPVDAERLSNGNTIISQYGNGRVTEVDMDGNVVWEMTGLHKPFDAERLPNGNTLIVEAEQYPDGRVFEVDYEYNEVWNLSGFDGPVDAERLYNETYGNTTLVTAHIGRNVTEFNESGAIIWEKTGLLMPKDAERLPNGNTQIAECAANRVIEVNPKGEIVWLMGDLIYPVDVERATFQPQQEPPSIEIKNPREGYFHILGTPLLPFLNKTFVYGSINIEVNVTSESGVEKVEFYINGEPEKTSNEEPYEYSWAPITCGKYTLETIVYDKSGQNASDSINIFKWRAHPLLMLLAITFPVLIALLAASG